jgi:hypothetical protein
VIEAASSFSAPSSKCERVWYGFLSILSRGISKGRPEGSDTTAAAAVISTATGAAGAAGLEGSSDSKPLPKARRLLSVVAVAITYSINFKSVIPRY